MDKLKKGQKLNLDEENLKLLTAKWNKLLDY